MLYDVSKDRGVRLADVDACDAVGCLLRTLATGTIQPQAALAALDLLKKLTRIFSMEMVDRVLTRDGPRILGSLLHVSMRKLTRATDTSSAPDADGALERPTCVRDRTRAALSVQSEIVSRALLLLCRWAALSPLRLQDAFEDFWKVLSDACHKICLGEERDRQLAYAFCGACVLSIRDASKLAERCLESSGNMRAVCDGIDAYYARFPSDRMPRMVVAAMMTRNDEALVRRALEVEGISFLKSCGGAAGSAILRGSNWMSAKNITGLAEFVVTSVGANNVFHADVDPAVRKLVVCELLEQAFAVSAQTEAQQGHACNENDINDVGDVGDLSGEVPNLRKETSMDSIILDTLCTKSNAPRDAGEAGKIAGKRGLDMIAEAYTASRAARPAKRARRNPFTCSSVSEVERSAVGRTALSVRIGAKTLVFSDRRPLVDSVGIVSMFENDEGESIDLPACLPTIPGEDRFAAACTKVLLFLSDNGRELEGHAGGKFAGDCCSDRFRKGDEDAAKATSCKGPGISDCQMSWHDRATYDEAYWGNTSDCWIVADYLHVDCDRLHAALYRASSAETIQQLLQRFPHMTAVIAKCAWQSYDKVSMHQLGSTRISSMIVDAVYDHLCEVLVSGTTM